MCISHLCKFIVIFLLTMYIDRVIIKTVKGERKMTITVKNRKELENTIREYRANGWMLITLGKKLAELENGNEIVMIEIA